MWVRSNMLAVYKDQPSMFLALSVVEQLRERCRVGGASTVHWPSLLADLITVMTDTQVHLVYIRRCLHENCCDCIGD